jgi:hypothetical protein
VTPERQSAVELLEHYGLDAGAMPPAQTALTYWAISMRPGSVLGAYLTAMDRLTSTEGWRLIQLEVSSVTPNSNHAAPTVVAIHARPTEPEEP